MPSRPVGGVWLRDYLLCFAKNGNMYVANISSILQYCHGMSIEGFLVFYRTIESTRIRGRGGLTARRKCKSSLLRPPPPLFPGSRSHKGGGVTAGQYGTKHAHAGKRKCYCCICVCDMNIFFLPWQDSQRNCFVFLRLLCLQNNCLVLSVSL